MYGEREREREANPKPVYLDFKISHQIITTLSHPDYY